MPRISTLTCVRALALSAGLMCSAGAAMAGTMAISGRLGDAGNTALVSSDLTAASFSDDWAIANNVALYTLNVATAGWVQFVSTGYAAGGIDPYFTLFSGVGSGATFLFSNYDHAFTLGGDFDLGTTLAAGDFTVAIGAFANMSFAEQDASLYTLGDGFTGLGVPTFVDDTSYFLTITLPDGGGGPGHLPEPSTGALLLVAASAAGLLTRRRRP